MHLHRYKITVRATADSRLPGFLGSFVRGVFGETLKRYHPPAFQYFFKPELPREHPYFRLFGHNPPAPYWFYIPRRIRHISRGETFHFFFTHLVTPFLPPESIPVLFMHAFQRPLYHRQFQGTLHSVEAAGRNQSPLIRLQDYEHIEQPGDHFRIEFPVPVSLMREGNPIPPASKHDLFHFLIHRAMMLRRTASMYETTERLFGKEPPPEDLDIMPDFIRTELLKSPQMDRLTLIDFNLKKVTVYRSPKRREKYPMRGWSGWVQYSGHAPELYKILKLGEVIHVGSNTSTGFGKIKILNNTLQKTNIS